MQQRVTGLSETARQQSERNAVVVIGPGQIVTAIVLRGMGWHVDLATDMADARRIVRETDAAIILLRVTKESYVINDTHIQDTRVVALVNNADGDEQPKGFDAVLAIDDIEGLTAYVRSTARSGSWAVSIP